MFNEMDPKKKESLISIAVGCATSAVILGIGVVIELVRSKMPKKEEAEVIPVEFEETKEEKTEE